MREGANVIELNEAVARKVLETVDAGLVHGLGNPVPGQMCVEAAVNYALGFPHGDDPKCVGRAVRAYKIRLNDSSWSSDKARAKGMRRVAIAQLGSDEIDQQEFRKEVAFQTIKQIIPIALRAEAKMVPNHTEALEACAVGCELAVDLATARTAVKAAKEKTADADADAAAAAAAYADAAAYAYADAYAAAYAAAAAAAAADADARDKVLSIAAEIATQALIKLQSKGAQWLFLCERP